MATRGQSSLLQQLTETQFGHLIVSSMNWEDPQGAEPLPSMRTDESESAISVIRLTKFLHPQLPVSLQTVQAWLLILYLRTIVAYSAVNRRWRFTDVWICPCFQQQWFTIIGTSAQTLYTLDVIAKDGGVPVKTDVTTVQINVTRNNQSPVWRVADVANITIRETQPLSESIGTVRFSSIVISISLGEFSQRLNHVC